MSIWGKIIGGTTGFAFGGPIGALIGTAAGHAIDRMTINPVDAPIDEEKSKQKQRHIPNWLGFIWLGMVLLGLD